MKRKEIKNIAKKISKLELIIQKSTNQQEKEKAEQEIMNISCNVGNLTDLELIDEAVQEILEKS